MGAADTSGAAGLDPTLAAGRPTHRRLEMLDGWRAISILSVMATHMLPLGPRGANVNVAVGVLGMAIFFTLSGFLVASILLRDANVAAFAIKRVARILPLAWLTLLIVLGLGHATPTEWAANLLFYVNLPPFPFHDTGHFWSLGVEMQFYAAIGLIVAVAGARGLWCVPVLAVAITGLRIADQVPVSIVTWYRVDEILAGATLALMFHRRPEQTRRWLGRLPFPLVALPFLASGAATLTWLNYARPYLAATMVGITIVRPVPMLSPLLLAPAARYVARISYALYIIHPYTMMGWLGSGDFVVRYAKRTMSIALSFIGAHLSTDRLEAPVNRWAHRVALSPVVRRRSEKQGRDAVANANHSH